MNKMTMNTTMNCESIEYIAKREECRESDFFDNQKFLEWYDKAAALIFAGSTRSEVNKKLSPWPALAPEQFNGVQAGMLDAFHLLQDDNRVVHNLPCCLFLGQDKYQMILRGKKIGSHPTHRGAVSYIQRKLEEPTI